MSFTLIPYQVCRSTEGWAPVRVFSHTTENVFYQVHVSPWGDPSENMCECPGYMFRGNCKHQLEASQSLCHWSELHPEQTRAGVGHGRHQTPAERKAKICPSCEGPTKWEVEVVEHTDEDA